MINTVEKFDNSKLNYILNHYDELIDKKGYTDDEVAQYKNIITKYLKTSRNGSITVVYKQRRDRGRFSAVNGLSMQFIERRIRHTIGGSFYNDIDMVNAHPVILQHLCKSFNILTPKLDSYIEKRDIIIKFICRFNNTNRDCIKKAFLSCINGGSYDIESLYNSIVCNEKLTKISKFIEEFRTEILNIHNYFIIIYKDEYENYQKYYEEDGKSGNIKGSFMNMFLCDFENKILQVLYKSLYDIKRTDNDVVLCFDGLMIPKNIEYDLNELERKVFDELNINIKLVEKPMNDAFDIPADIKKYEDESYEVFSDYTKFISKKVRPSLINEWINNSIIIVNTGGNEVIYSKERVKNQAGAYDYEYTPCKLEPFIRSINVECHVINPDFDIEFYNDHKDKNKRHFTHKDKRYNKYLCNTLSKYFKYYAKTDGIKRYKNIKFEPYFSEEPCKDENEFNLFTGFALLNKESNFNFENSLMYKHIRDILCNGDEGEFNHLLDHIADIIQDPGVVKSNAHLFYSRQGVGKDLFGTWIQKVIGGGLVYKVNDVNRFLKNSFNAHTSCKLLKIVNELSDKGSAYNLHDHVKAIISQEEEQVERKGVDCYSIKNFSRFWFFTNNKNSLYIEPGDRRFTLHICNNDHANDRFYFEPLINEVNNLDCIIGAFKYFSKRQYSISNVIKPYYNDYKKEQQICCLNQAIKWLIEFIPEKFSKEFVETDKIYDYRFTLNYIVKESEIDKKTLQTQLGMLGIEPKKVRPTKTSNNMLCYDLNPADILSKVRTLLNNQDYNFNYGDDELNEIEGDDELNEINLGDDVSLNEINLGDDVSLNEFDFTF